MAAASPFKTVKPLMIVMRECEVERLSRLALDDHHMRESRCRLALNHHETVTQKTAKERSKRREKAAPFPSNLDKFALVSLVYLRPGAGSMVFFSILL